MSLGLGPKFKLVTSQQPAAKIKEKNKNVASVST